jgi:protein phosphatase
VAADASQHPVPLQKSDTLVLCTDGLWSVVNEREIVTAVNEFDPEQCCRALVNKALERGGPDNITVQVIRVGAETD